MNDAPTGKVLCWVLIGLITYIVDQCWSGKFCQDMGQKGRITGGMGTKQTSETPNSDYILGLFGPVLRKICMDYFWVLKTRSAHSKGESVNICSWNDKKFLSHFYMLMFSDGIGSVWLPGGGKCCWSHM